MIAMFDKYIILSNIARYTVARMAAAPLFLAGLADGDFLGFLDKPPHRRRISRAIASAGFYDVVDIIET
jgi:hypothetical protein